jgi:hypothetical protein
VKAASGVVAMIALGGCGSRVAAQTADSVSDAGAESLGEVDALDAAIELGTPADVGPFDGMTAPLPGEFPPSGDRPCIESGCVGVALCDYATGWCCSGFFRDGKCTCGDTPGCPPNWRCCAPSGATALKCLERPTCPK